MFKNFPFPSSTRRALTRWLATALTGGLLLAGTMPQAAGQTYIITTLAGTGTAGAGGDNGAAASAQLNTPNGVAMDGSGNVYIADQNNHRVRKVDAAGTITTFAGTGVAGYNGDNQPAANAQLNNPNGVAVDGAGTVYISDNTNHRIRKVSAAGIITTVAGTGSSGFSGDGGAAASAQIYYPRGVAVDAVGNVYIADNSNRRVRKVDAGGIIRTIAGTGTVGFTGDGGAGTSARIANAYGIAVDGARNVYIADQSNNRIRKVDAAGTISTFAGTGTAGVTGDGGLATNARLNTPAGVAADAAGNVYILGSQRVRKVDAAGIITTIAGTGTAGYGGDGGAATSGQLRGPFGIFADAANGIYVADTDNHRLRRLLPVLLVSTGTLASPTAVPAGAYGTLTVTGTGVAQLSGAVQVAAAISVQSGGALLTNCQALTGAGSFTLAAGGTLGICDAAGISSSGATGAVRVTGTRSFSADASYVYNGTVAQATGTGLPGTVRSFALDNDQGATLGADLTVTANLALTAGVLATGSRTATLGSTATLAESADGYVAGTVQTTRDLSAAGAATTFGGLGLTLTPDGSALPGSTLVRRLTGTALRGAGTSQVVSRSFDIQPTVRTGLDVALALTVRDDERNGIAPADLLLFKSEDGGSTWQPQRAATVAGAAASGSQPATHTASLSGIGSFSVWTLGAAAAANPLPVALSSFTARAEGRAVRLAWATASEQNSARFDVERSPDGRAFAKIGEVAAAGSTAAARTYGHPDATAPAGLLYYRLRQVDLDGSFRYSPVRTVRLGATALTLAPNPAPAAHTRATGLAPGAVVDVSDALGRPVLCTRADAGGQAELALPAGLAPGLYLVRSGARTARLVLE